MKAQSLLLAGVAGLIGLAASMHSVAPGKNTVGSGKIKHVLLLSIDGMHAVDFYNCANGIAGVNGGEPYCPNMAMLSQTGINYVNTESSKPSDSFPGMAALASITTSHTIARSMRLRRRPVLAWQPGRARLFSCRPEQPPTTTRASTWT